MIVIEGFDASGKSTLANRIGELLKWPVLHTGGPTRDEADVIHCLHRSRQRMQKKVVQDRITHISESVYSMTEFPAKAALAINAIREIPTHITLIYCRPPPEFLLAALTTEHAQKAWDTGDHMERVERDAKTMIAFYDTIMHVVGLRVNVVNYNRTLPSDTARIMKMIEEHYL